MRARSATILILLAGSLLLALEPGSAGTRSTLWILSGQSNACGRGALPGPHPTADVRMFDPLTAEFVMAEDPLPGMNTKGVSAWVTAAQGVSKQGHKIDMVGYALGAKSIDHWKRGSEGEEQLSSRIGRAGKGAGVFLWYQGESDTSRAEDAAAYQDRLADLVGRVRRAADNPRMTAVVIQLGAMARPGPVKGLGPFMPVREAQRQFVLADGNALLLTALGRELKDGVHLATSGYVELGDELSRALLRSRFDQVEGGWPGPVLDAAVLGPGSRQITAHFAEVKKLSGVTVSDFVAVDGEGAAAAIKATAGAATIELSFQREIVRPARFFYAYGDAPKATLVDEAGNRAPAVQMDVTAGSPPVDELTSAPCGAGPP